MKISTVQVIGITVLLAVLSACTQGAGTAQSASSSVDAMSSVAASTPGDDKQSTDDDDAPITHIDCEKIFSPADVAGILDGQVTISVYPYRDNACHFESAAGSTFNLYSGNGFTDQLEWKEAAANAKGDYERVPGVGDQAFFGHGDLLSKKGDYYCAIGGTGGHPATAALLHSLGALCNKVYAAR
ncbi:MAG: hypothetical protein V4567_01080 [Pseudomonadota bacterium]